MCSIIGLTEYVPSVDLWSVGCVLLEPMLVKPILPGKIDRIDWIIILFNRQTK